MPKLIQTTGDRGLDRELDDLRREIAALKVVPAAAAAPAAAPSNPTGQQIPTLLDDLDDVNASAPASGDVVSWDGSQWSNNQILGDGSYTTATTVGGDTVLSIARRARYRLRRG